MLRVFHNLASYESKIDCAPSSARLRAFRAAINWTPAAVADAVGIPPTEYTAYEAANLMLPLPVAIALAVRFGISLDWLYGRRRAPMWLGCNNSRIVK